VLWNQLRPRRLEMVPGTLVAVVVATVVDYALGLPTNNLQLPANLLDAIQPPPLPVWSKVLNGHIWVEALALAFVASAESLMSASAVDRQHSGVRTDYNRELAAQGAGNLVAGLAGVLPLTGVIVRSSANVEAGAISRRSAVLHAVWLIVAVVCFPSVLQHIPIASLAAILVYTGYRLIRMENIQRLATYGRMPLVVYAITLVTIVATDLLTGVLVGMGASLLKLLLAVSRLTIATVRDDIGKTITVTPIGVLSFFRLSTLSKVLDGVPAGYDLVLKVERLTYIDQSCLEMLANWEVQEAAHGKSLLVEWDAMAERNWGQARKIARATGNVLTDVPVEA
jgi:MFS superfamily sulfate permease-like transporter